MTEQGDKASLSSPTLSLVFDDLLEKLSRNIDVDEKVIKKLDELLRSGDFPRPDELYTALFPPPDSEEGGK